MDLWILLALANVGGFWVALQALEPRHGLWSVLLAAAVFGFGVLIEQRRGGQETLSNMHYGMAGALLLAAVPQHYGQDGLAWAWLAEAVGFCAVGYWMKRGLPRVLAAVATMMATGSVLLQLSEETQPQLIFNERFALYAACIVMLGALAWVEHRLGTERDEFAAREWTGVAVVLVNLLALLALNLEMRDFFRHAVAQLGVQLGETVSSAYQAARRLLDIESDFAHSALWMAYGAGLMWTGFARRSAFLRWQALVLLGATVVKVFLFDMAVLDKGYRIASFIVLGAILLGISYAYQKDWLGLKKTVAS